MRKFKNEAADITKYTYKNYLYIVNTRRPNISPLALFAFNSISEEENILRPTYRFFLTKQSVHFSRNACDSSIHVSFLICQVMIH